MSLRADNTVDSVSRNTNPTGDFTIFLRVRPSVVNRTYDVLFWMGSPTAAAYQDGLLLMWGDFGNRLEVWLRSTAFRYQMTAGNAMSANTVYDVIIRGNTGTSQNCSLAVYAAGSSTNLGGTFTSGTQGTMGSTLLMIGNDPQGDAGEQTRIELAKVWNAQLNDTEVGTERLYAGAVRRTNLWGEWNLRDSTGGLLDLSGNDRDLTANNSPTWESQFSTGVGIVVADSFTNTDGTALGTHNAEWVTSHNDTFSINTNSAYKSTSNNNFGAFRRNVTLETNNQFAEGVVTAITGGVYTGVCVRASGSVGTASYYYFVGDDTDASYLGVMVNNSETTLATVAALNVNDRIRLEAEGTTIRAFINGSQVASVTNSALTSGQVGIAGYGSGTGSRLDRWAGGDLYVAASSAVTITDAGDELFLPGETGITISGTNFGAAQGAGAVYISPTDNVADGSRVAQTVTGWSDTLVTITIAAGALARDTNLYLFVVNNSAASNSSGYVVQIAGTPTITDAGDERYGPGESFTITGANFGASQGAGAVYISPTNNVADGGRVAQTVTNWTDTAITVTCAPGALSRGTDLYLFVLTNAAASNASGYVVRLNTASQIERQNQFGPRSFMRTLVNL